MSNDKKPREFWITESRCTGKQSAFKTQLECWGEIGHGENEYHVIEASALESANAEIEKLRAALTNCRMQFADCMSRVKAPDSWMIQDIDAVLKGPADE